MQIKESIITLFQKQTLATPAAVAVEFRNKQLDYHTLDLQSSTIANYLRNHQKITSGCIVAVLVERSLESLPVLLGILKTGAAFFPLDSDYPIPFLEEIILDCNPDLLIIDCQNIKRSSSLTKKIKTLRLTPELFKTTNNKQVSGQVFIDIPLSSPACILYTSGSMGRPKGIVIPHRALTNQVAWCQDERAHTI